jgi:hypothetical protein
MEITVEEEEFGVACAALLRTVFDSFTAVAESHTRIENIGL